ncbi:hypothetical protein GCM10010435_16830 [Winogradskya consettensis]|uniref:DUF1800 domain-containing protein n=1 Tax=Winogradskya consettensis TaxID=113560 RepID=A0A919SX86_9ACTN|nr:DUF1800 domain-containing protein [Actinoplanes consettensis]GIM78788.1 hypothetical protein Aco04nite_62220 [Actinoplanes consettensis]
MTLSPATSRITRRRVVGGTAAVGAALVVPAVVSSSAASAAPATELVPADADLHLLRRATYGLTAASVAEIRRIGRSAWLDRQLDPASIRDDRGADIAARFPLAGASNDTLKARVKAGTLKQYAWDAMYQTTYAATSRAIWSERQLFEVMVDFWSNHLNVTCPSSDVWDSRPDYDRTVIRAYAFGRFADMLKASARHPAMLTYLDNRFSTKTAPNENYGRELLELHTVGLVYNEQDVKNAARLLTGLTVDWNTGNYKYAATTHATGPVSVLGFSHPNATAADGEPASLQFLDYLALHPATARRIATKLCVRFVSDTPPDPLVTRLAKVYLDNGSAIVPVLRALFTSTEFAASRGQKSRTPYEDLVASVRALALAPDASGTKGMEALYYYASNAGQGPMAWATPDGYPDVESAWSSPSGLLTRWNAHLNLAAGYWPTELTRPANLFTELIGPLPATYGALVDTLAQRLFGQNLSTAHRATATAYFSKTPADPLKSTDSAVGWAFPYLVACLLNSPYFGIR